MSYSVKCSCSGVLSWTCQLGWKCQETTLTGSSINTVLKPWHCSSLLAGAVPRGPHGEVQEACTSASNLVVGSRHGVFEGESWGEKSVEC